MHALPLLSALVDPYVILFRHADPRAVPATRFGDEPNPEARLYVRRQHLSEPMRPR